MKDLQFQETLIDAFAICMKNLPSLLGCVVLWVLTIWIPYLNVGTTIAIVTLPVLLSRGSIVSPLEIFDGRYRRNMGEFFLVFGFINLISGVAFIFLIIPGIVMLITYMFAPFLVLDKGMTPQDALEKSKIMTSGNKWKMFFIWIVAGIAIALISWILGQIWSVLSILWMIAITPYGLALIASMYKQLNEEAQLEPLPNE